MAGEGTFAVGEESFVGDKGGKRSSVRWGLEVKVVVVVIGHCRGVIWVVRGA